PLRTVDMLTTAYPGEPQEMIVRTLEALVAVRYPHTTYLCDEGDDPALRAVCQRLGVVHVTRQVKVNAKAGNINNALRQATGELCVVLDPDHEVTPDFLDQVVAYFDDPTVGYVQVVQAYGNQADSLVALGAAEQTYHFYGPLMMGMNAYNTVQAIGANCTFRRAALDSIGGHAAGLTEDMHTAMRMHAKGWKSVYAPVVVSRGLVPSTLGAFYMQQLKWARGTFDLLFHVYPKLFRQFSWRQRLHYFTVPFYFLSGVVAFIDVVVPAASLLLLKFPWHLSLPEFALHMLPVTIMGLLVRYQAQRWLREPHEPGLHLAGGFLRIATWWVYTLGLIYTIINVRVPYLPTPKEGKVKNEWLLCVPNLLLAFISIGAAALSLQVQGLRGPYVKLMATLALINAAILLLSVLMAQHRLLNGLRELLWASRPLFALKRGVDGLLAGGARFIGRGLGRGSLALAASLAVVHTLISAGVLLVQWREQTAISEVFIWAHTGYGPLRIGQPLAAGAAAGALAGAGGHAPAAPASRRLITWASPAAVRSKLVSLEVPAGGVPQVPVAAIEEINRRGDIPVLTWTVTPTPDEGRAFRQQIGNLIRRENQVLLRPLLPARSPTSYRAAWQQLVKSYRAAGDTTAVWVWTPPRPDSLAVYFPGSANLTWMASDCRAAPATNQELFRYYSRFREQVAIQIEMQSKSILLLVPQAYSPQSFPWAKQVTERYPEVKALLFQPEIKN
ncbi:glycosyltransferase, partial [uncultured Hymenobacter sp.]|uniref:glycosyltransferase n=1 Tax=uncultured Hymenobacter sp. TaxID=170016 RepID=UPI0035CC93D2